MGAKYHTVHHTHYHYNYGQVHTEYAQHDMLIAVILN